MADDVLRYDEMVERALRDVARQALVEVAENGLPGNHHFYLSFRTDAAGVDMPAQLRAQHPAELTIVLQHQFWDLAVAEDAFTVTVSFNQQPNQLTVPFGALLSFVDPAVNFGLQFNVPEEPEAAASDASKLGSSKLGSTALGSSAPGASVLESKLAGNDAPGGDNDAGGPAGGADVVTLDNFRKK